MRRPKFALLGVFIMTLLMGVGNLLRYSEKVRFHDFVGAAAGGALVGISIAGIVVYCVVSSGKLGPADKKPEESGARKGG